MLQDAPTLADLHDPDRAATTYDGHLGPKTYAPSPEVYGPALEVPEEADAPTRFLALLGRCA